MTTNIERLILRRVSTPLTQPYKLSFGPVLAFDTVLVEVIDSDGNQGWGEATVLTGYTDETIEQAWETAREISEQLQDQTIGDSKVIAMRAHGATPFTATAFVSALEMAEGHPALLSELPRRASLLAIVNSTEPDDITEEIEARLAEGYRTLKIKVGFALKPDMDRLAFIQQLVAGRAALRVDANQAYSEAEGVAFIGCINPTDIELVEQTCAAGDWSAAVSVAKTARRNGVPFMLDESIYDLADVDKAAELDCADIIKLKLMKMGGLEGLGKGLDHIRKRGMRPVLGNGVAGDIGCWMETCIAADRMDNAGEMNGFLKPQTRLFDVPMHLENGDLILTPDTGVSVDRDALDAHTLDISGGV